MCSEVMDMADYKQMYIKMAQAAEKAIRVLIAAEQDCENLYLSEDNPEPVLLLPREDRKSTDGE